MLCIISYYFLNLPHSHEKIVATSKHILPSEIILLLSPQPTRAQVQTSKSIFQLQMKTHRRLKQIMIIRGGRKINLIAKQCTRHCTALVL